MAGRIFLPGIREKHDDIPLGLGWPLDHSSAREPGDERPSQIPSWSQADGADRRIAWIHLYQEGGTGRGLNHEIESDHARQTKCANDPRGSVDHFWIMN